MILRAFALAVRRNLGEIFVMKNAMDAVCYPGSELTLASLYIHTNDPPLNAIKENTESFSSKR